MDFNTLAQTYGLPIAMLLMSVVGFLTGIVVSGREFKASESRELYWRTRWEESARDNNLNIRTIDRLSDGIERLTKEIERLFAERRP